MYTPGKKRIPRKVSVEHRLVGGNVLVAAREHHRFELGDAIDQQHRVTVRQDFMISRTSRIGTLDYRVNGSAESRP